MSDDRAFIEGYVRGEVIGDSALPIYPHPAVIQQGIVNYESWSDVGVRPRYPYAKVSTSLYADLSSAGGYVKVASFHTEDETSAVNCYCYRSGDTSRIAYVLQKPADEWGAAGTITLATAGGSAERYLGYYQDGPRFWLQWCYSNNLNNYSFDYFAYGIDLEKVAAKYNLKFRYETRSEIYGGAADIGGYTDPTFDDSSDVIAIPTMPSIGVSSVGFVNVYNISTGGLQSFGSELFPNLNFSPISNLPAPADVTDALVNVATVLVEFGNQIPNIIDMYINNTLINYIIDCHIIPVSPATGANEYVKVGFKTFNQPALQVTSDYVDFDCGTLNIGEYYANFADYEPYTRAKLFLPFVGFVDLKPEFWQSGSVNVTYRFNVIDGSFMAFVKSSSSKSKLSDSVIAQYGGNCCVHIPITGANYSNMVSGIVSGAAAVYNAQPGTGGSVAVGKAVELANTKANIQQSNSYNATTSFLGVRVPYLLIERTVSNMSASYPDEIGIPANIKSDFADLAGYVRSDDVILNGITGATVEELQEIGRLLAEGVIL